MTKAAAKAITFRLDAEVKDEYGPNGLTKGKSGVVAPASGETRVECPQCGSPHLASFNGDATKYAEPVRIEIRDTRVAPWLIEDPTKDGKVVVVKAAIPGFECQAGDCGYKGVAARRAA
jgi:hypothetical protein